MIAGASAVDEQPVGSRGHDVAADTVVSIELAFMTHLDADMPEQDVDIEREPGSGMIWRVTRGENDMSQVAPRSTQLGEIQIGALGFNLMRIFADERDAVGEKRWEDFAADAEIPDPSRFSRCMSDERVQLRIREDSAAAADLGIPGTPTFVVNDRMVTGFGGSAFMDRIISDAKARANAR